MDILACILKIYPDWQGAVWDNTYEGIKPNETETRPIPTLAELEAVWPEVQADRAGKTLKEQAQSALEKANVTVIRCYEHSVAVPSEWPTYCDALRAIISGTSTATELPTRPDYPAGT